ncbi:MAG: GTPase ObgE, partial [Okeania sp. SIO2D1]|nr:GTPase ObgE [Okeania sp. SIO2D1]
LMSRFREITGGKVFLISAVAGIGLKELMEEVWQVLELEESVIH